MGGCVKLVGGVVSGGGTMEGIFGSGRRAERSLAFCTPVQSAECKEEVLSSLSAGMTSWASSR